MRWSYRGRSRNVEDRRSRVAGGAGIGIGGAIVLLLLSAVFGVDLTGIFSGGEAGGSAERPAPLTDEAEEPLVQFVSFVLDDAQAVWRQVLSREGVQYRDAQVVLFRQGVRSACGFAPSAVGPFYCPADEKIYVDLSFYDELRDRFGAPGDFAQAYVLAHEIGHHIQTVLGISSKVRGAQRASPEAANALSVKLELQADCFAGVWGHSTARRDILERGDIEEGLNAAAAIGDDRLQRTARSEVNPDSFTHGSSAQRVEWFRRGLQGGEVSACNTVAGN
jgi:hypothetical protein